MKKENRNRKDDTLSAGDLATTAVGAGLGAAAEDKVANKIFNATKEGKEFQKQKKTTAKNLLNLQYEKTPASRAAGRVGNIISKSKNMSLEKAKKAQKLIKKFEKVHPSQLDALKSKARASLDNFKTLDSLPSAKFSKNTAKLVYPAGVATAFGAKKLYDKYKDS
jgi:selenocysteine-specific translation elongation factor